MRSEFGETDSNFGNGQIKLNPHLINETFQPFFNAQKNLIRNFIILRISGLKNFNFEYPKQWSFGPEGTNEINLCMTIFGLIFFASLIISPIPGLLIGAISKKTGSDIKAGYFIFKLHIQQNGAFFCRKWPQILQKSSKFWQRYVTYLIKWHRKWAGYHTLSY